MKCPEVLLLKPVVVLDSGPLGLLSHRSCPAQWTASAPITTATSLVPLFNSRTPAYSAASDDPQAASMAMFGPPRLNRFATRPAATFSRMPGNESSVHSGRMPSPSLMTSDDLVCTPGMVSISGMHDRNP